MNESIRTLVYVGVGLVAVFVAYASRPGLERPTPDKEIFNKPLFEKFTDPLAAKSLEIKQYDEDTARARSFMVAQERGQWVIPSHGGYPADAESQLRAVAETLADLKIIARIEATSTEHSRFGVVDPDKAEVGSTG